MRRPDLSGIPVVLQSDRQTAPVRAVVEWTEQPSVPVPVAPLAHVPDATLRRRARKGDREAVAEMGRRGRLDGCGLHRGTITEDAARRAGYRGCGGAKVFFLTYRQERPVPGVPIVANWVWARIGDRLDQLVAGCLTVVPDGGVS